MSALPDEMRLPPGKTCADCAHVERCLAFGYTPAATSEWCDWAPARFVPQSQRQASPERGGER